jgi:hypothetical protein
LPHSGGASVSRLSRSRGSNSLSPRQISAGIQRIRAAFGSPKPLSVSPRPAYWPCSRSAAGAQQSEHLIRATRREVSFDGFSNEKSPTLELERYRCRSNPITNRHSPILFTTFGKGHRGARRRFSCEPPRVRRRPPSVTRVLIVSEAGSGKTYTEEEKEMFKPVLQRLVRTIRSRAANRCTCHRTSAASLA